MKKIYSIVLMATALLIGTNAWAATRTANDWSSLQSAWQNAENGDVIQLTNDIALSKALWLGTTGMNDAAKSLTLDLNGHTLSAVNTTVNKMFIITHGELNVINGNIVQTGTNAISSTYDIFHVSGSTYKTVNAKTAESGYYSHLNIAANVTLTAHSNAIVIDRIDSWYSTAIATKGLTTPASKPYDTNVYTADRGLANGARVDIYGKVYADKYCVKANGNMGAPASSSTGVARSGYIQDPANETAYAIEAGEELLYSPFIYIHSGAELKTDVPTSSAAIAAYSGGYSRWMIEGTCVGSTGVYIKSGQLEIKDATIASNYQGEYNPAKVDRTSGVDAGGSGIVMESATAYAGGMDVTVSGNTTVKPSVGYALDEAVSQPASAGTKVNNINIEGGEFQEGTQGTIKVTQVTTEGESTTVAITGGTFEFANETGGGIDLGGKSLEQFLTDQATTSETTHTVVVSTDDQGHQTIVISDGNAPIVANSVIAADQDASINWINATTKEETLTKDMKLAELQISQDYNQKLTIPAGKTLEVGRVVLGAKAQIVVEAGGKFVVTGEQGLAAFQESNLVLKTSQDAQAIFLFHPNVTSNRHPKATVQFISKAYRRADNSLAWQRFGIPSFGALTNMEAAVPTAVSAFDPDQNTWIDLGVLGSTLSLNAMAEPFAYYQMANNTSYSEDGTVVTMQGQLFGNDSPSLSIRGNFWNGFANSYMAPISGKELLDMIPPTVDKVFYLNVIDGDQAVWKSVTLLNMKSKTILPMQPFLIRNTKEAAEATIDYSTAVYYTPAGSGKTKPSASPAPAREHALNDITMAELVVKGENGADELLVAEGADFSAEFDNGYDAAKYMNDGFNMYVSAVEKMSIFATDNLEDTYVGFQSVKGGEYTIEFANVEGKDLTLVDLETGVQTLMVEGNTYTFNAAANTTNDYRFQIINTNGIMTGIENAEAAKSAKGIYTITGIYVGEMNLWNALPAGVYVVNGEKRVK